MAYPSHTESGLTSAGGGLARPVGPLQFFALAFGCTVGSGWVVVLGDWLAAAGPGGVILGFSIGATVMLAVAACYAELASRMPRAGGEIVYAHEVFGPRSAFFVGWFLTLSMIATGAFEGTALGWICGILWPQIQGPTLYQLFGEPMHAGSLALGLIGTIAFSMLNYAGIGTSTRFQSSVTLAFLLISLFIVVLGLTHGQIDRVPPWWQQQGQHAWWVGVLWIIGITPFFLNGFQAAAQAIEERRESTSFGKVAHAMYAAVLFAGIFYSAIVLACSMAAPWMSLIKTPMATAAAMNGVMAGGTLSRIVLIAAAISILKTWNGVMLWAARLLLALGRAQFIPRGFAAIHPRLGSPHRSVAFVAVATLIGIALGRGALLPIVGMAAICLSMSLVLTSPAVFILHRRSSTPAPYTVPGGMVTISYAVAGSGAMAVFALISPWLDSNRHLPLEWISIIVWGVLGIAFWLARRQRGMDADST